jgi:hypothetical protein
MSQQDLLRSLSPQRQQELDQIMKLSAVEGFPKLLDKLWEWNEDFTQQLSYNETLK